MILNFETKSGNMKPSLIKYFFIISLVAFFVTSCKKDVTDSKVGVAEGQISLTDGTNSDSYVITDILTKITGDTTTIILEAMNKDSSNYMYIGFQKLANFGVNSYDSLSYFKNDTSVSMVFAYIHTEEDGGYFNINYQGKIDVLFYQANDELQGSFEFLFPDLSSDSVSMTVLKGEFFASYSMLDPNRVPNLAITPRTMVASINGVPTLFSSEGGLLPEENEKGYVVNGTLPNGQTVTLSFKYFIPKINKKYTIGKDIIEGADSTGRVEATYFENGLTYFADEKHGSGTVMVTKISSTTLQGKFDFTATLLNDTSKKVNIKEGQFYTRLRTVN